MNIPGEDADIRRENYHDCIRFDIGKFHYANANHPRILVTYCKCKVNIPRSTAIGAIYKFIALKNIAVTVP